MLSEVFIYVPSISRYRKVYLEARIADGHLSTLVLQATPNGKVPEAVEQALLEDSLLLGVELDGVHHTLMLGDAPPTEANFILEQERPIQLIKQAFITLFSDHDRIISVTSHPKNRIHSHGNETLTVYLNEAPLQQQMVDYSWRILTLSIIISLITASFLYFALQWSMIRPMRRITRHLISFSGDPEDPRHTIRPSGRSDELGVMELELKGMQGEIRSALAQKERLAVLGDAVSRINHDLRNILSTVGLLSERMARSDDPAVQKVAPMLATSVSKAVQICTSTVDLARGDQAINHRETVPLHELVREVGVSLGLDEFNSVAWHNTIPTDITVEADHDRLFRVFLNLGKNAEQAIKSSGDGSGNITIEASQDQRHTVITVCDDGPGLPDIARKHLFQAFVGSASKGGSGLGLTTARDLMRAHGGELSLSSSNSNGSCFEMDLPGCI
jgi:signal transduction histidine kinase